MRRFIWPTVTVLVLALVVGFVATGGVNGLRTGGGDSGVATDGSMGGGGAEPAVGAPDYGVSDEASGGKGGFDLGAIGLPTGPSVIRYGDLSVIVEPGDFDAALEEANAVAARYGGYIVSSSVGGGDRRAGMVSLRVRASDFDLAMGDLRDLGELERESVSGQDVGMQVVDIEARLDAWKAQRDVLLRLLDRATSVSDTLKIQVELQNVQMNIEQLTAELTYLQDQVALATISVSLREPGATGEIEEGPRFGDAWARMVEAFLGVVYAMIVGLGYVIPIALAIAAIAWAVRRYRRWRRA